MGRGILLLKNNRVIIYIVVCIVMFIGTSAIFYWVDDTENGQFFKFEDKEITRTLNSLIKVKDSKNVEVVYSVKEDHSHNDSYSNDEFLKLWQEISKLTKVRNVREDKIFIPDREVLGIKTIIELTDHNSKSTREVYTLFINSETNNLTVRKSEANKHGFFYDNNIYMEFETNEIINNLLLNIMNKESIRKSGESAI